MKDFFKFLLPWRTLQLQSSFSAEEVLQKISALQPPDKSLSRFQSSRDGKFQGEVTGNSFTLMRRISYRNSFLPVITGTVVPSDKGSLITVTMQIHYYVKIFIAVWISVILLPVITALLNSAPASLGLLIFAIIVPNLGFQPEAEITKKFLCSTFDATEI